MASAEERAKKTCVWSRQWLRNRDTIDKLLGPPVSRHAGRLVDNVAALRRDKRRHIAASIRNKYFSSKELDKRDACIHK